jgi:hypothetical protein
MRTGLYLSGLFGVCLLFLAGCIEPFELPTSAEGQFFLVVDGGLNVEEGTGQVRLTRTQNLADTARPMIELMAQVTLEESQGNTYRFTDQLNGEYILEGADLNYNQNYRLRIRTLGGREYLSEFVSAKRTPAIDSLSWVVQNNELQIQVNTHDPENNTRYYRWEIEETWRYTAALSSSLVYRNGQVVPRGENIYQCYKTERPSTTLIGTSANLTQDVISRFPLTSIGSESPKLRFRYSILVNQYGISQDEYNYWQMLRRNTESVGTLFDPQPALVRGNFTCLTNPEEPVLGYFSARSVTQKRIFINAADVYPYGFQPRGPSCTADTIAAADIRLYSTAEIVSEIYNGPFVVGYTISTRSCVDCRVQGGTTERPDFWE